MRNFILRASTLLFSVVLLFCVFVPNVYAGTAVLAGDANGDGFVDNKDLVRLKKYLAAYDYDNDVSSVEIFEGADANGDGIVDNKDLIRVKKYLANYDYDDEPEKPSDPDGEGWTGFYPVG